MGKWNCGVRYVGGVIDRAKVRLTTSYQMHPRFSAGIEVNPLKPEVTGIANWLIFSETKKLPAIIAGTSSDRIGSPHGQAFYVTASKSLQPQIKLPIAPYAGVAYGTYRDDVRPIAGVEISPLEWFSTTTLYDGRNVHQLFNLHIDAHSTVSLLFIKGKHFGLSYGLRF